MLLYLSILIFLSQDESKLKYTKYKVGHVYHVMQCYQLELYLCKNIHSLILVFGLSGFIDKALVVVIMKISGCLSRNKQ